MMKITESLDNRVLTPSLPLEIPYTYFQSGHLYRVVAHGITVQIIPFTLELKMLNTNSHKTVLNSSHTWQR